MYNFITDDFINYIIQVEGSVMSNGKHFPYGSPEGGRPTIGYGHKMFLYEDYLDGITEEKARELLQSDLVIASIKAANSVGIIEWRSLDDKRKEILTDYTFNLGSLRGFPKFTKAVLDNNLEGMRKEYKRYYHNSSGKHELTHRNETFYNRYLRG